MKKSVVALFLVASMAMLAAYAGGVISVNIADGSSGLVPSDTTEYGLAPAPGNAWINVTETSPNPFEVDLGNGAKATFSSTGSFGRYKPDGVTVDASAPFLKRYLDDNSGVITVTVTGIPFMAYKLIVYLGADYGYGDGAGDFQPISVNSTWYGYADGKTVACGSKDYWGTYGTGTAVEGVNTLCIPSLLGSTLTFTIPSRSRRSCLSAFQIVETELAEKIVPGAISVNFGSSHGAVSESGKLNGLAGGLIMAESWNNFSEAAGEAVALKVWDGQTFSTLPAEESKVNVTWTAGGTYYMTPVRDVFLAGYLEDNSTPSVTVLDIPWEEYDLIVYLAADWGGVSYGSWSGPDFNPIRVNGDDYYTWSVEANKCVHGSSSDYWGEFNHAAAEFGVNAIRIAGLTGSTLSFNAGQRYRRGGIAAFQIVKPFGADIVVEGDLTTWEINRLVPAGEERSIEMAPGCRIVLGKKPLNCEGVKIICSGDVVLDTDHEPTEADEAEFAKLDLSGVRGLVFHDWKPTRRVISINVNSGKGSMSDAGWSFAGALAAEEIVAASWNDIAETTGSGVSPIVWDGEFHKTNQIAGLEMAWSFSGFYGLGDSPDVFRRGWSNTSGAGSWTLALSSIPFSKYDVLVYMNWDGNGSYSPVKIGDDSWTWDAATGQAVKGAVNWGESQWSAKTQGPAVLGENVIRIKDLDLSTLLLSGYMYCNVCAIQVVEHVKPRKYSTPLVITVR